MAVPRARQRRSRSWLARVSAALVVTAGVTVLAPGAPAQAETRPVITSVSDVVAQDPKEEGTGPTFVINGYGFGNTPPTITESPTFEGSAGVGDSALGVWANTANLHIEDEGTFATDDIGFYHPDADVNSCYLTIGKWTDTQIIVMLDDADVFGACSAIDDDDAMRVMVWSTDDGGRYGVSPDSGWFDVGDVVPLGFRATVDAVSPANGPVGGGTFRSDGTIDPQGTITVHGDRFDQATVVWFGDGGYSGGIAVARCGSGQDPATSDCFTSTNNAITVRPPRASANEAKGVYMSIATEGGTSHLDCSTVYTCDGGVYYYQSPSEVLGSINEDIDLAYPNTTFGVEGAVDLGESTCPGSAPSGLNEITYSITATSSAGKLNIKADPYTSTNTGLDLLSSMYVPTVLTISEAVELDVTLEGSISGCVAIPLLGGKFGGDGANLSGGLFMMIGGNLKGSYTYHVVINRGTVELVAGYVPGGVAGADILKEDCVDEDDEPAPCLETSHEFTASGNVIFSPLWLDLSAELGPFTFAAGAGISLAGTVQASTDPANSGYEICYGGTYVFKAELDADIATFLVENAGAFWGPFHLAGNNPALCALGEIEEDLSPTEVGLEAGEPEYDSEGSTIVYSASVDPGEAEGTFDFYSNGEKIADCAAVEIVDGAATCSVSYDGTGKFKIEVVYSGDRTHLAGSASLDQTVTRLDQVITFALPDTGVVGTREPLTATGGDSGEDVVYSVPSTSVGVCRLAYDDEGAPQISFTNVGVCSVVAKQGGNGGYKAATPVTETVTVSKGSQSITFTPPTGVVTGGSTVLDALAETTPAYDVAPASAEVCELVEDGDATALVYLAAGVCTLEITAPEDARFTGASQAYDVTVGEAPTTTTVSVDEDGLRAEVAPLAPTAAGGDLPTSDAIAPLTGEVRFTVDGTEEYLATLEDGVATVELDLAGDGEHVVEAEYLEESDPNYAASDDSTDRSAPLIESTLTSARPISASGWYLSPVTITTTCTATTAPLSTDCPAPLTLSATKVYPDLVRTVEASDGGVGTEIIRGLQIDLVGPRVNFVVRNKADEPVRVRVRDQGSGVETAETTVTRVKIRKKRFVDVYKTVATDVAGNTTITRFRYKVPATR
ncbi:Ig-like domain-containing protein [Nocardioides sp.]|uniref:Ig-like domain-containing protein n=1 Tax=Nocardioides sp. TaxID=35761 RepID=UPI00351644A8